MKITVPTSWSDVSIKQFRQLLANESDKSLDEIDLKVSHIVTLTGVDYTIIEELHPSQINELYGKISFIGSNKVEGDFPNSIKLGDKIYHCEPKANMTYGQYKAMREWTKSADTINDNLHNIVSLFITEPNKKYSYQFEEKSKLILEHCKMNVVFHISGFFLKLYPELLKAIQTYSLKKAETIIIQTAKEIETEINSGAFKST